MRLFITQNTMISQHWSHYWQAGQLTSLPQDFQRNYTGSIQKQWTQAFNELHDNSHILDVCAGNCAISLLAATHATQYNINFNITAVDAADINKHSIQARFPNQKDLLKNISLISNCKVEDITLASQQFDLITSQYGIEYCNWDLAAQQIYRLLKPKAHFIMIAHSGSTEIIKTMCAEKCDYDFLQQINLFHCFKDYYNNDINYASFITRLKTIQKIIIQRFNSKPSELIKSILLATDGIVSMQKYLLESNKVELIKLQEKYDDAHMRLNDLLSVTEAINDKPHWYESFERRGLQLQAKKTIFQNVKFDSGTLFKFQNK